VGRGVDAEALDDIPPLQHRHGLVAQLLQGDGIERRRGLRICLPEGPQGQRGLMFSVLVQWANLASEWTWPDTETRNVAEHAGP
jgi:hypothetical protein